jgi:hypothetical protein
VPEKKPVEREKSVSDQLNAPTQDTMTPQQMQQYLLYLLSKQHGLIEELIEIQLAAIWGGTSCKSL